MEFEINDRVIYHGPSQANGMIGRIAAEITPGNYAVEFDKALPGLFHSCRGFTEKNRGWYVPEWHLMKEVRADG